MLRLYRQLKRELRFCALLVSVSALFFAAFEVFPAYRMLLGGSAIFLAIAITFLYACVWDLYHANQSSI